MPGIDVMDAVGTNIRLDVRQRQVMRVLPRINDDVNEEWAHDKTRHHVDALVRGRLDRPWVREGGKLQRGELGRGVRRDRQAVAEGRQEGRGDRRRPASTPRRCMRPRRCSRASGSSLLEGRQTGLDYDVSSLAAVRFNTPIAEIENADVDPAGRHQPALGSAAGQHPHPQGGAARAPRCSRSGRRST